MATSTRDSKPRIAVFSGPTATIQNTEPLVTSNKARDQYGLKMRSYPDGSAMRFDVLRSQICKDHRVEMYAYLSVLENSFGG